MQRWVVVMAKLGLGFHATGRRVPFLGWVDGHSCTALFNRLAGRR